MAPLTPAQLRELANYPASAAILANLDTTNPALAAYPSVLNASQFGGQGRSNSDNAGEPSAEDSSGQAF